MTSKVSEPDAVMRQWPEQDRPTVKLFQMGASALTDSELVAVLLRTGHKDQSAVEVARDVIGKAGSLAALMRGETAGLPGCTMKPDQRARLQATLELARRCLRENMAHPFHQEGNSLRDRCPARFGAHPVPRRPQQSGVFWGAGDLRELPGG